MALIFEGHTKCELCGKELLQGDNIVLLPAISDGDHPLYKYFDQGFHSKCFEDWDNKSEIEYLLSKEQKNFRESEYFRDTKAKYGKPNTHTEN